MQFPHLLRLRLGAGWLTILENPGALRHFPKLRKLELFNCFGLRPEDCPTIADAPLLDYIHVSSVPADIVKHYKKHRADFSRLDAMKPRNDDWLRNNLHNPFRDWDGRDGISQRDAKAAAAAYVKASKAFAKLPQPADATAARDIVAAFLTTFSKMKSRLVTMEREEVGEVAFRFIEMSGNALPPDDIDRLFGQIIDF